MNMTAHVNDQSNRMQPPSPPPAGGRGKWLTWAQASNAITGIAWHIARFGELVGWWNWS